MTQKILCPKCFESNTFYAEANKKDELLLKCKSCSTTWNLGLKPKEPPLIQGIKKK